jgi:hypothetical protein
MALLPRFKGKSGEDLSGDAEDNDALAGQLIREHRLFGYDLDGIREYDLRLSGGRTHIVESYALERDLLVDLPFELASSEAFASDGTLRKLVRNFPHVRIERSGLASSRRVLRAYRDGGQSVVEPTSRSDGSGRAN